MQHQDAGDSECQQYRRGHPRSSTRAPLLQEITIVCKISFRPDPVNRFSYMVLMWVLKKKVYCLVLHYIIYFPRWCFSVPCFSSIYFSKAAEIQSLSVGSKLPSLWLCRALRQTIIFCIAICKLPLQMTDILNRMSGPHNNRQAHS